METRTPCAFVVERHHDHESWEITPVYSDDWNSETTYYFARNGHVYSVSGSCEDDPREHLNEGDTALIWSLSVDGEAVTYSGFMCKAFSTEKAARDWMAQHGQPCVECPSCSQPVPVRRYKTIYEGWLDHEEQHLKADLLISEHDIAGVMCHGSRSPAT